MTRSLHLALCLGLAWLTAPAAAQPSGAADTAYVYRPDGTRDCDASAEIPLDAMAQELIRGGTPVHTRRKSHDGPRFDLR